MKFKDYYDTLGVPRDAGADDIKRAYRRLARKYHPDVSKEADAETRFKEMKEAYEVLKDPEKRSAYDQFGENWKAGQNFQPPPDWQRESTFRGGFSQAGGQEHFSDFFESLFGGQRGGFGASIDELRMNGQDINATIQIPIEEAYRGGTRSISLEVPEAGPNGQMLRRRKSLNVNVPKGILAGQRIRLAEQGEPGSGSGTRAGDLYLQVNFEPHPVFEADGRDIHVSLPVSPSEAALGRTVKTPTLGGPVDLKIPAGSGSGARLRLKGRGLPGKPPGDQYVRLSVELPKTLSAKTRELYEQLEKEQAFNPRSRLGV